MACFLVPAAAAIIATAARKKISQRYHVEWLLTMLWGGVAWLIPEHIYHGEIVLYPPFFTADLNKIISEVIAVGIPMVVAMLVAWSIMVMAASLFENKKFRPNPLSLLISGIAIVVLIDRIFS